ncbi:M48 family metallopeptidase [Sediminispirochaeta smaragdinae]|jgi:hypothetical protein|uniref:YgjP-like metallopeptidase domain-containing protein n=1 Tax=Sediminispirochaeta smaragdinae (strain DSM 11293 / JCM 15392 / SEBR 4228) TaxID=573413 RepID=E1RBH4_SEDSS|nr:SprT family zinc-dependent metalloprotease [Sediminispirochaeta smaragdinae]ADK79704.1 protein of unknown function DUF45 [Sediminispirochaeta smaragdinae DSM 11293]
MSGKESIPLRVGTGSFDVSILRRKRQKHIRIKISGSGNVSVSCPVTTTQAEIERAIETKRRWIAGHLWRIEEDIKRTDPSTRIFLNGKEYPVEISTSPKRKSHSVTLDQNRKVIVVVGPNRSKPLIIAALKKWLEAEARQRLKLLVREISAEVDIPIHKVFIRNQRSRWGSSSSGGNISLNWRVIMLEPELQRYLVIHELCHQIHLNHSKLYWKEVERLCPNYAERDKQLRNLRRIMALFREE